MARKTLSSLPVSTAKLHKINSLTCSLAVMASPLLSEASVGVLGGADPWLNAEGGLEVFLTTCTSLLPSDPTVVEGFTDGWEES